MALKKEFESIMGDIKTRQKKEKRAEMGALIGGALGLAGKYFLDKKLSRDNFTDWNTGQDAVRRNEALHLRKTTNDQVSNALKIKQAADTKGMEIWEHLWDTEGKEVMAEAVTRGGENIDENGWRSYLEVELPKFYQQQGARYKRIADEATKIGYNVNITDKELEAFMKSRYDDIKAPSVKKGALNIIDRLLSSSDRDAKLEKSILNNVFTQRDQDLQKAGVFKRLTSKGVAPMTALGYVMGGVEQFRRDKITTTERKVEDIQGVRVIETIVTEENLKTGDTETFDPTYSILNENNFMQEKVQVKFFMNEGGLKDIPKTVLSDEAFANFNRSLFNKLEGATYPQDLKQFKEYKRILELFLKDENNFKDTIKQRSDIILASYKILAEMDREVKNKIEDAIDNNSPEAGLNIAAKYLSEAEEIRKEMYPTTAPIKPTVVDVTP
tara:strand:+ start:230 stop:1552 length:1323 start_codon:yes stop_codon:yes gene_type:complete